MKGKRKQHSAAFKVQVALAAVKGDKTVNELASQYGVHPTLIHAWKKQLLAGADQVFSNGSKAATADAEVQKAELIEQGEEVNRKRVQRLMRVMGLEAIYPKPKPSAAGREHRIYPYLLRKVS